MKKILPGIACVLLLSTQVLNAQCGSLFYDGFESGSYAPTWTAGSAPITWSVGTSTPNPAAGTYRLQGTGGNSTHLTGLSTTIASCTPSTISWYMYPNGNLASNYVVGGDNSVTATNCAFFCYWVGASGQIRFISSVTAGYTPATLNTWYLVEMRNINWSAHTFDIYIDNVLVYATFPFRSASVNSLTRLHLYNFNSGSSGYWDNITVGGIPVTASSFQTAVSCNGGSNGSATASATGGNGTYTYNWLPSGGTAPTATGLTAGTYSCIVTDGLGCPDTTVITVTEPTAITATTMQTNVSCFGGTNGDAMVMPSGGTGGYTYLWSNGGTGSMIMTIAAGVYTCTVTDVNGCAHIAAVTVTEPPGLVATSNTPAPICMGDSTTLTGAAAGGTPGYTYTWNPGGMTTSSVMVNPTSTVAYTLTATDTNGCTAVYTTTVTVNALPVVNLGPDTTVCGSIVLDAGNPGSSYAWTNGDTTQQTTAGSSGIYQVTISDVNGCVGTDSVDVTVDAVSDAGNIYHTGGADLCVGDTSSLITLGANANVDWWVLPAAGPFWQYIGSGNPFTQQIPSPNDVGLYYFYAIATNGVCPTDTSNTISIEIHALPAVQLGADTAACSNITLDAQNAGSSYAWTTGDTTQTILASSSGQYSVTVMDMYGCSSSDTIAVTINQPPAVTGTASSMTPCQDDADVVLTGLPAGGTWSGSSVTGNLFDPSIGPGAQILTYAYTDTNGCSGQYPLTIVVSQCVGIAENAGGTYSVYPNPNNGTFTIAFEAEMNNVIVEMLDVAGNLVLSEQYDVKAGDQKQINVTGTASGIYVLRMTTANGVSTQRIIITQ